MMYDITMLVLSTCLHLGGTYEYTYKCQAQLTACHKKISKAFPGAAPSAAFDYCLMRLDHDKPDEWESK